MKQMSTAVTGSPQALTASRRAGAACSDSSDQFRRGPTGRPSGHQAAMPDGNLVAIAPTGTGNLRRSRCWRVVARNRYDMRQQHAIAAPVVAQVVWQVLGRPRVRCARARLSRANHRHTQRQRALTRQQLGDARCKSAEQPEHQHDQNHALRRPWLEMGTRAPRASRMAGSEAIAVGEEVQHQAEALYAPSTER